MHKIGVKNVYQKQEKNIHVYTLTFAEATERRRAITATYIMSHACKTKQGKYWQYVQ